MLSLGVCCFSSFQWYEDTLSSIAKVNCFLKCRSPLFSSQNTRMLRQSTYRSFLSALRVFHPHSRNPSHWHPTLNPVFKNAFSKWATHIVLVAKEADNSRASCEVQKACVHKLGVQWPLNSCTLVLPLCQSVNVWPKPLQCCLCSALKRSYMSSEHLGEKWFIN